MVIGAPHRARHAFDHHSSGILRMLSTEKSPPHKLPDNDNDDPPAVPLRVAVPMPVPAPEAEPRRGGFFD
jgi:hypothetical protein